MEFKKNHACHFDPDEIRGEILIRIVISKRYKDFSLTALTRNDKLFTIVIPGLIRNLKEFK